ncbi:hypothetical protein CFOL_v3_21708 [Cephalotus follicularis]|uniref:Uncharacterized protein n=1 Tax=Cephalotus follicularis TaxID=3775 RepID=A0A1Q3CDE0_CEPFO|nr:hypothetical protein CFOL_v3_21708 [Cephalotus follicularis]
MTTPTFDSTPLTHVASPSTTDSSSSTVNALSFVVQPPVSHIHHFLSIKLTSTNYLIWRSQFLALLRGYDLRSFVDGSSQPPARLLPDGSQYPAYTLLNEEICFQYSMSDLITATANMALTQRSSENRNQHRGRGRGYGGRRGCKTTIFLFLTISTAPETHYHSQHSGQSSHKGPSFCNQCHHHSNAQFYEPYQQGQNYHQAQVQP